MGKRSFFFTLFVSQIFVISQLFGLAVLADATQEGLSNTQKVLNNPNARTTVNGKKSPDAKAADDAVKALTGGNAQLTDEMYKLASEVFANIVKDCKGDPKKMKEALLTFQKNPGAFVETWTPEQRQKLTDLSQKLEPTLHNK